MAHRYLVTWTLQYVKQALRKRGQGAGGREAARGEYQENNSHTLLVGVCVCVLDKYYCTRVFFKISYEKFMKKTHEQQPCCELVVFVECRSGNRRSSPILAQPYFIIILQHRQLRKLGGGEVCAKLPRATWLTVKLVLPRGVPGAPGG